MTLLPAAATRPATSVPGILFPGLKGPVMEAFDTVKECLAMMSLVVKGLGVNRVRCRAAMTEELYAAERAHELVKKGVPFRDAYRKVGRKYV